MFNRRMNSSFSSAILLLFNSIFVFSAPSLEESSGGEENARRVMLSFKETPNGVNVTFECFPSGPCVPCAYSEKSDTKYRCSETGYRIPFKCEETRDHLEDAKSMKNHNRSDLENANAHTYPVRTRILLEDLSTSESGLQAYITYRSCITTVSEERLSVIGFEEIMLVLLIISGSTIYYKKKRMNAVPGGMPVRIPSSSRI
ncbi:unnamed protein product [Cuscuta epithymum]|uniref:Uncharacterized protein n=1 Tax=Cuscuta epithymum TaxID=186058 RepID=A0AAV0F0Q2_9ASTE|nr:unnamed protein product [Cuscuta epithymum]CAH9129100.1 unnamed protein product [Cuscuta epithymum]